MSTLQQLRHGLGNAWDSLADGWRQLRERASQALTRFTPVRHRGELETADEQLLERASRWGLMAAEVKETDDEVVVRLEAPGLEPDDFDISVIDDILVVRGEKRLEREEKRGRYHVMERAYGSFERAIQLPAAVDDSRAKARYRRGVLKITLPKARSSQTRRIDVSRG